MRITLLDALPFSPATDAARMALADRCEVVGDHRLRAERFAPCDGCWECWVEHPGTCKAGDASNAVMMDIIGSDLVIWFTRPRFGVWDPFAKCALDKAIGLLSPFFETVEGETHHKRRYRHYPRWMVVAELPPGAVEEAAAFRTLVARNVLNMHGETNPTVVFLEPGASAERWREAVIGGLISVSGAAFTARRAPHAEVVKPRPEAAEQAPDSRNNAQSTLFRESAGPPVMVEPAPQRLGASGVPPLVDRPRKALLWVGSAKPGGESTSESLGIALLERLQEQGWAGEVARVSKAVKLYREQSPGLVAAAAEADLLVLATPVYVDCLPTLVLAGLERLCDAKEEVGPLTVLPIVQCGFPEEAHTRLAVDAIARACAEAKWGWAGHLALGGGGFIDGRPLEALGGRVHNQLRGLDMAASALTDGSPIPGEAAKVFAKLPFTPAMYRAMGQTGWLIQGIHHRALRQLWDRPFPEANGRSEVP